MTCKRIDYIDVFRGLGIMLMVMGHVGFGVQFDVFIHAFHMPMFFFITGFLYKGNYDLKKYFISKCKTLLLPYFSFGLFHIAIMFLLNKGKLEYFTALFYTCTNGIPIAGALWFLLSLFFADMIFFFIEKIGNNFVKLLSVIVISVSGQLIKRATGVFSPFGLSPAFVGVGLMYIGKYLRKNEKTICNLLTWRWFLLGVLSTSIIGLLGVKGYVNMRTEDYPYIIMFWVVSLSCIVCGLNISRWINEIFLNSIIGRWLKSIGKNSIVYVVLNQIIIMVVNKVLSLLILSTLLNKILCLIASMMILLEISIIVERTKLKVLFGKF